MRCKQLLVGGQLKLGVSVRSCADITAPKTEWKQVGETHFTIPVSTRQGFMILQSSDEKVK